MLSHTYLLVTYPLTYSSRGLTGPFHSPIFLWTSLRSLRDYKPLLSSLIAVGLLLLLLVLGMLGMKLVVLPLLGMLGLVLLVQLVLMGLLFVVPLRLMPIWLIQMFWCITN